MADIFETAIGMAEPALKIVGGFVSDLQATIQGFINTAVAEALKAAAPPAAAAPEPAPPSRMRPLRAPGR
jgi:hypothetical protein